MMGKVNDMPRCSGVPGRNAGVKRIARSVSVITIGAFVMLLLIGAATDGVERWNIQYRGAGMTGTLRLERTVETSVGRPPPITSWAGTYTSHDGSVERFVRLGESLPDDVAGRAGSVVPVRWQADEPDVVFLADGSRAFTNWVEGKVFLAVGGALIALVAIWRRRRHRIAEGSEKRRL
jgi:hypothetical protein